MDLPTLASIIGRSRALGLRVHANRHLHQEIALRAERGLERAWALQGLMQYNLTDCRKSATTLRWAYRRLTFRVVRT